MLQQYSDPRGEDTILVMTSIGIDWRQEETGELGESIQKLAILR